MKMTNVQMHINCFIQNIKCHEMCNLTLINTFWDVMPKYDHLVQDFVNSFHSWQA